MKNLNIPALATAITLIAPVGEGCSGHIQDVQDDIHQRVEDAKEREGSLLRAELAELAGNFGQAAESYTYGGNKVKAKEMWLKYAHESEQDGSYGVAGWAYEKVGDEAKAKEMLLKYAREMEEVAYKNEDYYSETSGLYLRSINPDLCIAAKAYEDGGDKGKASELYLKYAQLAEQKGYLYVVASVYEHIGDKTNARRMWLKYADVEGRGDSRSRCKAAQVYEHIGYIYKADEIRQWGCSEGEYNFQAIDCF